MYDSRSDHPHKGLHLGRWYSDMRTGGTAGVDGGDWQESNLRRRYGTDKDAIAEGLSDYLDEHEPIEYEDCEDLDYYDEAYAVPRSSKRKKRSAKAKKEAIMQDPNRNIAVKERSLGVIHKPRVTKHRPRVTAEPFDPSKVSATLSPRFAAQVSADQSAKVTN
jgi:hypothetical protein